MTIRTLRLYIHLFRGKSDTPEIQIWEREEEVEHANPLLLRADVFGETFCYLFSLDRVVHGVAYYHPYATHEKQDLMQHLPKFGYRRMTNYEEQDALRCPKCCGYGKCGLPGHLQDTLRAVRQLGVCSTHQVLGLLNRHGGQLRIEALDNRLTNLVREGFLARERDPENYRQYLYQARTKP